MSDRRLVRLAELEDPGSCSAPDDELGELIVVHRGGEVWAYRNVCPHTGAPLDWQPGRFLSVDGLHIQCALHGALFRIEDGSCLYGPCRGEALQAVPVSVREGWVCREG
ncbi:MAG TPA: Rieske (2Fe-2S) protein [Thiotrichales bacterium]|nr:Rieske (2Fe-2S) protein [Thiotrichales bacterium]